MQEIQLWLNEPWNSTSILNQFYILFQEVPEILLTYVKNLNQKFKLHVGQFYGILIIASRNVSVGLINLLEKDITKIIKIKDQEI